MSDAGWHAGGVGGEKKKGLGQADSARQERRTWSFGSYGEREGGKGSGRKKRQEGGGGGGGGGGGWGKKGASLTGFRGLDNRRWSRRGNAVSGIGEEQSFKIVSYNVLAHHLEDKTTAGLDSKIANWCNRSVLIAEELAAWDADIICLQEVDHYEDFFMPLLEDKGYAGIYLRRAGDKKDGCATFWKTSSFSLVGQKELNLNMSEVFDRDNVALIVKLEGAVGARRRLVVANTHVLFNKKRGDIKLQQAAVTIEALASMAEPGDGIIYCGDFNTSPFSPMYDYISQGRVELGTTCDAALISGQVTWDEWVRLGVAPILRRARGGSGEQLRDQEFEFVTSEAAVSAVSGGAAGAGAGAGITPLCRFFSKGWCNQGSRCKFTHNARPSEWRVPGRPKRRGGTWGEWARALLGVLPCDRVAVSVELEMHDGDSAGDGMQGQVTEPACKVILSHTLSLRSAYANKKRVSGVELTSEPAYTSYHGRAGITVDYVWVSPEIDVCGVWEMLSCDELETPHSTLANRGKPFAGLPSHCWGSDHMALACHLSFT